MENFFSLWKVRELADKVTNVVMNYTDVEAKVREATNDEAWGPTGQIMQDLAHATFTYEHFPEVMSMLWKRMLQDNKQHWRRTYKSLLVLNYLIKNGSERVVTSAREHIYDLRSLENYTFIDDYGKDQGVNVRHKVKELIDFIQDDDKLREERKKAKKNKDKYIGMSSDMMGSSFSTERWEEHSSNRDYADHREIDNNSTSVKQYKDRSYEDDYEGELEESDNESNNSNYKKYKDSDSATIGSPKHGDKKVNLTINTSLSKSPVRAAGKPIKKVDLGAAASFGVNEKSEKTPPTSDLLNDADFNPRAAESAQPKSAPEFGDFETAFANPPNSAKKDEDDFADFSSAFSATSNANNANLVATPPSPLLHIAPSPQLPRQPLQQQQLVIGQPPQLIGAQPVGVRQSDLLGDLSGFSSLNIQSNVNNANNLNSNNLQSNVNNSNNIFDMFDAECAVPRVNEDAAQIGRVTDKDNAETESSSLSSLDGSVMALKVTFSRHKKIRSTGDIELILMQIDAVLEDLEKYHYDCGKILLEDSVERYRNIVNVEYPFILNELIGRFDSKFPLDENGKIYRTVQGVFLIADKYFASEAFKVLTDRFAEKDRFKQAISTELLESLLLSDSFFEMLFLLYIVTKKEIIKEHIKIDLVNNYTNLVQVLITLPNRVSNSLSRDTPEFFSKENMAKLLLLYIIKMIVTIIYIKSQLKMIESDINYELTAMLLGKVLLHYNESSKSIILINFIKLLTDLNANYEEYKEIIHSILDKLERVSVEVFLTTALQNLDPATWNVSSLFSQKLIENNKHWNYIICSKIPLFSYFNYQEKNLMYNLVQCLRRNSTGSLLNLYKNLISAWSNKSSITHTSLEHHLYVSKLIVLTSNASIDLEIPEDERNMFKEKIHSGVMVHLQSGVDEIRAIGMICSEIVVNNLGSNIKDRVELKFEYDNLKNECKTIVDDMRSLIYPIEEQSINKENIRELTEYFLNKKEVSKDNYVPPERRFRTKKTEVELSNEIKYESMRPQKNVINIIDSTDFELDSDDDLESYDVSNDKPATKKTPPAYLRDLRDGLLETQDAEIFVLSIENCEKVVCQNLPNDDASVGLEILEILITQPAQFYVENYEQIMFECCVAITCIYPRYYAEYLCEQIHAEAGKYAISHRLLMMEILCVSARRLSEIKPTEEPRKIQSKSDTESASEIIRKRLETKTKYYFKHKPLRKEQKNIFSQVAGSFFYPLLYGLNKNFTVHTQVVKNDSDHILLTQLLRTLSTVLYCSQNAPVVPKMGKDVFVLSWILKYHREARVRVEILNLLCTALLVIPKSILLADFLEELLEIRLWLVDVLSPNVQKGESNSDCRYLADTVLNPAPAQVLQPSSNDSKQSDNLIQQSNQQRLQNIGATWSNSGSLNIDLDNLLVSRQNKQGQAPSMNQLASTPINPVTGMNQPRTMMINTTPPPVFGSPINFNHPGFSPAVNANLMQANNQFFPAFK
ncbi:putative telomere length regulation protein [Trypoxylus dichotomus]